MLNKIENALIVLASTIGIANIDDILGIVILCVQLILLIIKCINKIKEEKYDEIVEDVEEFKDALVDYVEDKKEEE